MHLSDHMLWYNPQLYCSLMVLLNWRVYLNQASLPQKCPKYILSCKDFSWGLFLYLLSYLVIPSAPCLYYICQTGGPGRQGHTRALSVSCLGGSWYLLIQWSQMKQREAHELWGLGFDAFWLGNHEFYLKRLPLGFFCASQFCTLCSYLGPQERTWVWLSWKVCLPCLSQV